MIHPRPKDPQIITTVSHSNEALVPSLLLDKSFDTHTSFFSPCFVLRHYEFWGRYHSTSHAGPFACSTSSEHLYLIALHPSYRNRITPHTLFKDPYLQLVPSALSVLPHNKPKSI